MQLAAHVSMISGVISSAQTFDFSNRLDERYADGSVNVVDEHEHAFKETIL